MPFNERTSFSIASRQFPNLLRAIEESEKVLKKLRGFRNKNRATDEDVEMARHARDCLLTILDKGNWIMNKALIRKILGEFYGGEKAYPGELPIEIQPWHCYAIDSGHNVLVLLKADANAENRDDLLVPAPVKAVVRTGWEIVDGYVVCDLPYSASLGLLTSPHDDEL